jgi:hypothetical protein
MIKLLVASTAILSLIGTSVEAQVIKTVENGRDIIYSRGNTAGSSVQLVTNGGSRPTAILANSCGIIRVSANQATPTSININGSARSIASPVTLTGAPVCNGLTPPWDGGTTSAARRDPNGNFYFSGYNPGQAATVAVRAGGNRTARANGCGIARFAEPAEGNTWGSDFSFTIGGTSYTLGSVTAQNYGPICRNVGTSGSPTYLRYEAAN